VSYQVLAVDDEKGIRDLVHDALSLAGFEVTGAADGLEALTLLRKQKWDLVILDINLPTIDGFSLLEKLREKDLQTPVLLLSARGDNADVTQGLKLGADDYVRKPFGLEELVLRAKALIKRTSSTVQSQQVIAGPITIDDASHEVRFNDELRSEELV
jgi:two-component system OmpR family response regulator